MYLQRFTDYLLRNRKQAIVLTFLISCIPMVGMVGILIAGLATLCIGVIEGAIFTLAATLPSVLLFAGIMFFLSGTQEAANIVNWAAVLLTVTGNVLTWVFAVMLRRNCSWSLILQVGALIGVLVISVIHLAYPGVPEWWAKQLSFENQPAFAGLAIKENQQDAINVLKSLATGLVTAFVLFSAVFQAVLSRWWQVTIVNRSRLGNELQYIHLSHLAGVLFLISIVFYYLENSVVLDILPVLCLLFSAAGLSLVHYLCGLMEPTKGRFWLSILYIALMYSLTMMALLPSFASLNMMLPVVLAVLILAVTIFALVSLSLFDVWFDIRKRMKKV